MSGDWRGRPVMVTGATGLLGGHLVEALVERGAAVTALVRDQRPTCHLVETGLWARLRLAPGDLLAADTLRRVLAEHEIEVVFHLAAQAIVQTAVRYPAGTFATNVGGTVNVLEAARLTPTVKAVVVASSDKAYGPHDDLPYIETMPLAATAPYDTSKACAELLARCYAATWELPVAITRCGNLYGEGDLNFNRLIPGTIRSILRGERPIIRSDGRFRRDYLYVADAAAAYLALAEALLDQPELRGEAFNFSLEQPRSVLEVVGDLLVAMASDLEPDIRNEAVGEIRDQYLSAAKARQQLGWSPRWPWAASLTRTVAWYADRRERWG